jgi:hypothetical protein
MIHPSLCSGRVSFSKFSWKIFYLIERTIPIILLLEKKNSRFISINYRKGLD